MNRARWLLPALTAVLTLTGCSVLAGRDVTASPVHPARTPAVTTRTPTAPGGGARLERADTVTEVLAAAKRDFETIYTFDYRDLAKYRAEGLKVTTGPYRARYRDGLSGATAEQLRTLQQVQVPSADHAGIVELAAGDRAAVVLVNGSLATSSTETTSPIAKPVTVALHLRRVGQTWKVRELTEGGRALGTIPGNRQLSAALDVSRSCVGKIFGLSRARFDADFAGVMACTTGELHARLQASRGAQRKTLIDGDYDLDSRIVGLGVARADGTAAELLVVLDEYRLGRQGSKSGPYPMVFDVIALRANGGWLLSAATQVS